MVYLSDHKSAGVIRLQEVSLILFVGCPKHVSYHSIYNVDQIQLHQNTQDGLQREATQANSRPI
jgi:hypothetical protein